MCRSTVYRLQLRRGHQLQIMEFSPFDQGYVNNTFTSS